MKFFENTVEIQARINSRAKRGKSDISARVKITRFIVDVISVRKSIVRFLKCGLNFNTVENRSVRMANIKGKIKQMERYVERLPVIVLSHSESFL